MKRPISLRRLSTLPAWLLLLHCSAPSESGPQDGARGGAAGAVAVTSGSGHTGGSTTAGSASGGAASGGSASGGSGNAGGAAKTTGGGTTLPGQPAAIRPEACSERVPV